MPTDTIIVLVLVLTAFAVFAIALAYGDYQTRIPKRDKEAAPQTQKAGERKLLKAA